MARRHQPGDHASSPPRKCVSQAMRRSAVLGKSLSTQLPLQFRDPGLRRLTCRGFPVAFCLRQLLGFLRLLRGSALLLRV